MARPISKQVHLYLKKGRPEYWVRFHAPPDVARFFRSPEELPEASGAKAAQDGRVAFSLHTADNKRAKELCRKLQTQLDLAWEGKLNHLMFRKLTDEQGQVVCSLTDMFAELEKRDQARVKLWYEIPNPVERRGRGTLCPRSSKKIGLFRRYLTEALTALYPGQSFMVHHFSNRAKERPNVIAIKDWLQNTRQPKRLGRESYKTFRDYFSGVWEKIAMANGWADSNPWKCKEMSPPIRRKIPRAVLTIDQVKTILAAESSLLHNALKLLVLTGTRPVELCWWQRTSLDKSNNHWRVIQTKTGEFKDISNTPDVAAVIADQLEVLDEIGLGSSNWLFPRYFYARDKGLQADNKQLGRALSRTLEKLVGVKTDLGLPITPYTTRRTVATFAKTRAKADPHAIADIMGHSNTEQQLTYIQMDYDAMMETSIAFQKKLKGA